jgi:hypothetical protein
VALCRWRLLENAILTVNLLLRFFNTGIIWPLIVLFHVAILNRFTLLLIEGKLAEDVSRAILTGHLSQVTFLLKISALV